MPDHAKGGRSTNHLHQEKASCPAPVHATPHPDEHTKTLCPAPVRTCNQTLLDFSYFNIDKVAELEDSIYIEPRPQGNDKKVPRKVIVEVENEDGEVEQVEKYDTFGLKLANNSINDAGIEPFLSVIEQKILDPVRLSWIDLSSNLLTKINGDVFCNLNVKILYLHDNSISDMKEVYKLKDMPKLIKLTLHCNPIAHNNWATYRLHVLGVLRDLKCFDFSVVTKAERTSADKWYHGWMAQKRQTQHIGDD